MNKKIKHRMRFRRSSDSRHATFSSRRTAGKGTSIVFDGSNGLGDPNRMEMDGVLEKYKDGNGKSPVYRPFPPKKPPWLIFTGDFPWPRLIPGG